MVSYETRNNRPWIGPQWMIDCGGFSALNNSPRYQFETPVQKYVEYVQHHLDRGVNIDRWALRDWPCEEKILFGADRSVRDHQRWTTRDHINCLDAAQKAGLLNTDAQPMTVLQGRSVDDYLWHLDYMREHGLLTDAVGVGTLCGREDTRAISNIIDAVTDALPDRCSVHGFGVKNRALGNSAVITSLDSVDSAAWTVRSIIEQVNSPDCRETWIEVLNAYRYYRNRLSSRMANATAPTEADIVPLYQFLENPKDTIGRVDHTIYECRCGTLVDPNAFADGGQALTGEGCRHCQNTLHRLFDHFLDDPTAPAVT